MASSTPEIANAKLSLYTKKPSQTFQVLQGEIAELVNLASRGEAASTRAAWRKSREVAVFKQAIIEEDRQLISRENQSRAKTGLHEMNLSQMTNFLIKVYSKQEAFSSASHLKSTAKFGEEVLQTVTAKSKTQLKKERRQQTQRNNNAKKEDLFAFHEWQNKNNQVFDNRNKGFWSGQWSTKW